MNGPPSTILVVEDNPITRKVMRVALASEGYSVLEADDGRTALQLARAECPALVLMDLVLPDMNGLALLPLLRALPNMRRVPIIACTGFLPQDHMPNADMAGFAELLVKPIEPSRLLATVNAYVGAARDQGRPGGGRRILVADDDEVQLKLMRVQLERLGFIVDSAHDGHEAMALARRHPPNAIVADVQMPRLDGFKLCLAIRKDPRLANIPLVLQSNKFVEEADQRLARRVGANAYLMRAPDSVAVIEALLTSLATPTVPAFDSLQGEGPEYQHRIMHQLERQVSLNAGLAQSYSQLASALSVLGATSDALARNEEVHDALHEVLDRCIDAAGISVGILYRANASGTFQIHAATGYRAGAGSIAEGFFGHPELLERAHASGVVLRVPSDDVDDETANDFLGRFGLTNALISPVTFRHERLGAILFGTNTRDIGGTDWLGFARVVSSQLGQAMALSRAFQQLRDSEEGHRELFESMPLPVWVFDLESRRILSVNEAAVRLYAYTREELLSLCADDLFAHADVTSLDVGPRHDPPFTPQPARIGRHRKKDGTELPMEVFTSRISYGGRTVQLVAANDISERLRTEAALAERERRFTQIANNIKEVFYVLDANLLEVIYVSPAYEQVWGRTCDSLYARPASFFAPVVPRHRTALMAHLAALQQGHDRGEIEYTLVQPDGGERHILAHAVPVQNAEGEVYRLAGVALDITDRKHAESALRLSEERFRALVEHSVDAIALLDGTGRITYASLSWERVLGYESRALMGRDLVDLLHPNDGSDVREQLSALLGRQSEVTTFRARFHHRDGSWRQAEGTLRNRLEDPAVGAIVLNCRDVTEQRELEERFRQSQKMEAVGQLASGVAHDFNNVLTAITGFAELLSTDLPAVGQQREYLDEISFAAGRAAALTRQLLGFSRQHALSPRVVDVREVVTGVQKMLQRIIGDDVTLDVVPSAKALRVLVDPMQLEQVILNLCVNARDAMPGGGRITLATSVVELKATEIAGQGLVAAGTYVLLSVADTGTGMTEEVQRRLFEPFFTTKAAGNGTGLGLASVFGIVRQSHGHLRVHSLPGAGSTFQVCLPMSSDDVPSLVTAVRQDATARGQESILLVDDDADVRKLTKTVLERSGYHVTEASGTQSALRLAERQAEGFALLLTDVVMPGGSGHELAQRLCTANPDMRVLFTSGYTDDVLLRQGMPQHSVNFLQKPFMPAVLLQKVREVLDGALRR